MFVLGFPGVTVNPPAKQETQLRVLGWEDPLEKEMAADSVFSPGKIPWTEEPGGLQSTGSQQSWTQLCNQATKVSISNIKNSRS